MQASSGGHLLRSKPASPLGALSLSGPPSRVPAWAQDTRSEAEKPRALAMVCAGHLLVLTLRLLHPSDPLPPTAGPGTVGSGSRLVCGRKQGGAAPPGLC